MTKHRMKRHAVIQPQDQSYRLIPLTQGQNAIVDTADFDWLSQWNWCAHWNPDTRSFYANRNNGETSVWMAREILDCVSIEEADHRNHDTLDNRRENLRKATRSQNQSNARTRSTSKSGYRGVSWNKNMRKWESRITVNRKTSYLGSFTSAQD